MTDIAFNVGEVVRLDYSPKMAFGTGSLVRVIEILSKDYVIVTTGCGQWMEKVEYLRKI